MIVFLESKDIILTPVSKDDVTSNQYRSWINDQNSDVHTQHALFPHTNEKILSYYEAKGRDDKSIWLAIKVKPDFTHVGNIDISSINWVNQTGTYNILIGDTSFQGRGLGYQSSMLILNHAFNRLNLRRVQLGVEEGNLAAISLYTKLGFVKEGILRSAVQKNQLGVNVVLMSILKEEFSFDSRIL